MISFVKYVYDVILFLHIADTIGQCIPLHKMCVTSEVIQK